MKKYLNHFGIILISIFAVSYLIFYPQTWLISDVNAYVNQAMAFAEGKYFLSWKDVTGTLDLTVHGTKYPLGNAFWLSIFIFVFGPKGAFLSGFISVVLSATLINRILIQEKFPRWTIAIFFIYASLLFFSRTLMSAMPSLLIISLFVYLLFKLKNGSGKYFWLAFLAGLSIWFRESNLMICAPLCLWIAFKNFKSIPYLGIGFLLGLSFRLISSWWVYGDPLFYVLAEPFNLSALTNNALVYLCLMTVMIPGAWIFNCYKGRYRFELISTIWIFLSFYIFYDFNATNYSGFGKGIILTGRFLIPLTPLLVIAMAGALQNFHPFFKNQKLSVAILFLTVSIIITSQYFGYCEHKKHMSVIDSISQYKDEVLIYDTKNYTNINRYVNAFNGLPAHAADIRMFTDTTYISSILVNHDSAIILESRNINGNEKNKRTSELHVFIMEAMKYYDVRLIKTIPISGSLEIAVYRISK